MTTPRAPATDVFLRDMATHLANLGLVRYAENYTGTSPLPALFFHQYPDKPDAAISLSSYNDDRSRDRDNPDFYIQIRGRASGRDPLATHALMDSIFDALDDEEKPLNSSHILWGTTKVLLCLRHIRGPLLADANNRWSRPDSYTITVNPS
ncbi:hypothetical protein CH304_00235 [Rhodococcus sp. 15-649-1-2]|nr:minor capsid protein [Rhodococcus sp. 15-649-1-2]OZE88033.1 hypothetical protein CH304_00235 [Rhodococcus sp. 15-649-1-2]